MKKDRAFKTIITKGLFVLGLIVMLIFSLVELSILGLLDRSITSSAPIVFLIFIGAAVIYLAVKVGQGGSRMGAGKAKSTRVAADDDSYWILGFFNFNKEDPSIFVERRFGIGWTLNYANPASWIALIVLIVLLSGILILPLILK